MRISNFKNKCVSHNSNSTWHSGRPKSLQITSVCVGSRKFTFIKIVSIASKLSWRNGGGGGGGSVRARFTLKRVQWQRLTYQLWVVRFNNKVKLVNLVTKHNSLLFKVWFRLLYQCKQTVSEVRLFYKDNFFIELSSEGFNASQGIALVLFVVIESIIQFMYDVTSDSSAHIL